MLQSFSEFTELFNTSGISYVNESISQILQDFTCFLITRDNQQYDLINERINQSNIIIIDKIAKHEEEYLIICFDSTAIIISRSDFSLIHKFFDNNKDSIIFILSKSIARLFSDSPYLIFPKYSPSFKNFNFLRKEQFNKNWNVVIKCIFSYLIEKSLIYADSQNDRINNFEYHSNLTDSNLDNESFFTVKNIDTEENSSVDLIYSFEQEDVMIIKFFSEDSNNELFNRVRQFYLNNKHPLIPKYYGYKTYNEGKNGLVIEYIRGQSLDEIQEISLTKEEKIKIIFELMTLIEYFHDNHYILRNLKPSNFIVNPDKTIVLVDFDHFLFKGEIDSSFNKASEDFDNKFVAPEITEKFSYEYDIYSLGMLIYFIISGENSGTSDSFIFDDFTGDFQALKKIILQCTDNDPSKRPKIADLIYQFYISFISGIADQLNKVENNYFAYWHYVSHSKLANLYEEEKNTIKANIYWTKVKTLMAQIIDNKDLQDIYLKFKLIYCDDENKIDEYLSNSKFETFCISNIQKLKTGKKSHYYGNAVICTEGTCIVFNTVSISNLVKNINKIDSCLVNASEPNSLIEKDEDDDSINEEINNFCKYYINDIINNPLIEYTIRPIVAYIIRRYFCPSSYFKDQSFFIFGQKTKDPINRVNLNNVISSETNLESFKELQRKLYESVSIKHIEMISDTRKVQFQTFQQNDFIFLNSIQSTQTFADELVIHIKSKYVFMLKKIIDSKISIDKGKFSKLASHDSFITFYGFLEKDGKVTGLIYDFLSNGKLTDYVRNVKYKNFYSLISLIRFFHGIYYISDNCQNRQKIDISDIYLDHDNIPYISYVFIPENEERKESRRSPSYINLIGQVIYLVFEKKELPKRFTTIPSITKCSDNIQKLYQSCISYRRGDGFSFDAIEESILDELEAIQFTEYYLNRIHDTLISSEILNLFYELIQLLVCSKRIDHFSSAFSSYLILPILLILKMKGDLPELNYQIGLLYENGIKGIHYYDKAQEYFELSAKENYWQAFFNLGNLFEKGKGVKQSYSIARNFYETAAENKNSDALIHLGIFFENGNGVRQNPTVAKEYFMQAANGSNSNIPLQIGDIFLYGKGVNKDWSKAIEYYAISASKNNSNALLKLGNIYEKGNKEQNITQDYNQAKEYYEQAGQMKNSEALVKIGDLYYYGMNSKPSLSDAKKYYEMAAELKNPEAFYKLGLMYKDGYGVIKDDSKANKYFRLYIELQLNILLNLGSLYEIGHGVKKNYAKAKEYYELALELNSTKALYLLALLYKNGLDVQKDLAKSEKYLQKFAKTGYNETILVYEDSQNPVQYYNDPQGFFYFYGSKNSELLVIIGNFYEKGQVFQKDCLKAKLYYELSCKFKNSNSYYRLGRLFEKGSNDEYDLIKQDYYKARDYYLISIGYNNPKAYYRLGNIFEKGLAGKQDFESSKKFFEFSANPYSLKSYYRLGLIYLNGIGVNVSINKAISYFKTIIKLYKNMEGQSFQSKYSFYYYLSCNDLGLINITSVPEVNMKKAESFLRECHYGKLSYSQNNLGLLFQFFTNKSGKAEYLFEEAGKQGFALAEYNLGYMNEQNEQIEKAIYFYVQASKHEDNPILFENKKIEDEYLEISKTFIICLTNLKLTKYYLSKKQYENGQYYFEKVFNKLDNFTIELNFKDQNSIFSDLKSFILDYPDFNLSAKPKLNRTKSRKIILPSLNSPKKVEKTVFKDEKYSSKMSFLRLEKNDRKVFNDPNDLFVSVIQNGQYINSFRDEIDQIIDEMDKILYKPPYRILFGRMQKIYQKPQSLAKPLLP